MIVAMILRRDLSVSAKQPQLAMEILREDRGKQIPRRIPSTSTHDEGSNRQEVGKLSKGVLVNFARNKAYLDT